MGRARGPARQEGVVGQPGRTPPPTHLPMCNQPPPRQLEMGPKPTTTTPLRRGDVMCCGVVWCGVLWCGVVWCGVVWCGVVWCGVVWCGVVWCGVLWCAVVWCSVVCYGVLCCFVLCCGSKQWRHAMVVQQIVHYVHTHATMYPMTAGSVFV